MWKALTLILRLMLLHSNQLSWALINLMPQKLYKKLDSSATTTSLTELAESRALIGIKKAGVTTMKLGAL